MDFTNLTANVLILIVTYILMEMYKLIFKGETAKNIIPVIALTTGAVLGVLVYKFLPEYITAADYVTAVIAGGFSGLSATGGNQIIKQLKKMFDEMRTEE